MDDDDTAGETVFMAAAATAVSRLQSMSHALGDLLRIVDRAGELLMWHEGVLRGTRTPKQMQPQTSLIG